MKEQETPNMKFATSVLAVLAGLTTGLAVGESSAQAQVCEQQSTQEALQYLRRLNLDLAAEVPDASSLDRVVASGLVEPDIIDALVSSDKLTERIRTHHRELLWGNIQSQELVENGMELNIMSMSGDGTPIYWVRQRARVYRGYEYTPCLDEPARFDAGGEILTTATPNPIEPTAPDTEREGWVEVTPYWNASARIKVCAFDAQPETSVVPNPIDASAASIATCSLPNARNQRACGCGPNLRWCQSNPDGTKQAIVEAMMEQFYRLSDAVARGDRPYTDFVLATDTEINGPLSHYFRHQAISSLGTLIALPDTATQIPIVDFEATDSWTTVSHDERYAGVLTMPLFLLRFTSDRGRANRFYSAFLCQTFSPPPGALPAADDACNSEPDLKERCGCKFCHVKVEPAAAYWGRWAEGGLSILRPELFPTERTDCVGNNNDVICRAFYTTRAIQPGEEPYLGMLRSYLFADAEMIENIEQGPRRFAQSVIDGGDFARCTTQNLWTSLLGRDVIEADQAAIDDLAADFARDHQLPRLIKNIITRPEYRQGQRFGDEEVE